jgi:hypothetical protein
MYTSGMSEIVARGCPEELVRTAKAAAAMEGLYFNEWIRRAVEEKLRRKSAQEDSVAASVLVAPAGETAGDGAPLEDCEVCRKPCRAWGAQQRRCTLCSRIFPR